MTCRARAASKPRDSRAGLTWVEFDGVLEIKPGPLWLVEFYQAKPQFVMGPGILRVQLKGIFKNYH